MKTTELYKIFYEKISIIEAKSLFIDMNISSVGYALIKGDALSLQAYGCLGSREFTDIDLMADKNQVNIIVKLLNCNGYMTHSINRESYITELLSSHQLPCFYKEVNGVVLYIDVNFDIFWGEYEGKRINIEEFLSDTIEMEIYGVKVKTLPPLKAMVQLILHHYKDMNSIFLLATRKSIKHEMFKDVYYLLKNNLEAISLDKLYNISAEYEIIPYVFYVLYYTGQIFDDDVLREYIEAFRTLEGERLLNLYGLCEKERKEWKCDFKTRLESENLFDLIKDYLTERDKEKIAINRRVFLGESE